MVCEVNGGVEMVLGEVGDEQGEVGCGAVTRVFFTSSYLTLQVNPGAFFYCKGHLNLRLFVMIILCSIDLKNTRVNGC